MKKYFATENIGHDSRSGQPSYKKGAEVSADHPNIKKWVEWGMVSEEDPNAGDKKGAKNKPTPRPALVPVFPIKADVSTADTSKESAEEKQRRVEAQSLSSLSGDEQAALTAKRAENQQKLLAENNKKRTIITQIKDDVGTAELKTDDEDRAKSTADKDAVARDKAAKKEAAKAEAEQGDDDSEDETESAKAKTAAKTEEKPATAEAKPAASKASTADKSKN